MRFIHCFVSWFILMLLVRIPLILIGYIVVPVAVLAKAYRQEVSKYNGREIYNFTWKWMLPWNNPEDGIYCTTYFDYGFVFTTLMWTLVRNPVNGLREVPFISCKVRPSQIEFKGTFGRRHGNKQTIQIVDKIFSYDTKVPHWFLCWQGWHSCFYWQFMLFGKLIRLWIGTAKLYPTDIYGVTNYRKYGAGMVSQLKVVQ